MIRAPTLHSLRRSRFLLLLVSMIALMLIAPFLEDSRAHEAYLILLLALIMLAAVRAASDRRSHRLFALVLGIAWVIAGVWSLIGQGTEPAIGMGLLFIVFLGYTLGTVLANVVGVEDVQFDTLLGAAGVYLMLGILWAVSYWVIEMAVPGSFAEGHMPPAHDFHRFLYFSLTTLTTLGYGDITPVTPFAQIWATLEAVVGTLYIALLVARLVGMYQSQRPSRRK